MALIFTEGWERYGKAYATHLNLVQPQYFGTSVGLSPQRYQGLLQDWFSMSFNNVNGSVGFITGRAGGNSVALAFNQTAELNILSVFRVLPASYSHFILGFAVQLGGQTAAGIQFYDISLGVQFSLWFDSSNHIVISRSGIGGGNILYTSTQWLPLFQWHYVELEMTVASGTSGAFKIWLDGVQLTNTTGVSTQAQTSSNVNQIAFFAGTANQGQIAIDDIYFFDTTGVTNNAAIGDCSVDTLFPATDSAVQFSKASHVEGLYTFGHGSTVAPGANTLFVVPLIPSSNCTLASVGCLPATSSGVAKFKGVIYSDNSAGTGPNTLLSSGTEVIGCLSGATMSLPLTSPQAVTAGTKYWIGYITDTSINVQLNENWLFLGQQAANTYTTGAPASAPAMTTGRSTQAIWGNATTTAPSNTAIVTQKPPPMSQMIGLAAVSSSTATNEDLYTMDQIASGAIQAVRVLAQAQKSASGARTMDLRVKSNTNAGNTDSGGSALGQTPGTSPSYVASVFTTDPDTGSAWTQSGVNNMKVGFKVAS